MTTRHFGNHSRPTNKKGFTLIEVMIVVAIIGILAAVAYPSYVDSIRKGKRAEARAALMNLLQQQERYFTQNNTYETFGLGAVGTLPFKDYSSAESGAASSSHRLGARACSPIGGVVPTKRDCIEVFAEPQTVVFTDPIVTSLGIDSQSRRSCNGSYADITKCWR